MWHGMWGWDGGWGWFGMVHLLWWVLLIVAAVMVFRWAAGRGPAGSPGPDRSIDILRERFARGEIDQREYDERLQHLAQGGTARK